MIEMYAIIAFALVAMGAALGGVIVVSLGIRREEKANSFTVNSPGLAASGGRAIMAASWSRRGTAYQINAQGKV